MLRRVFTIIGLVALAALQACAGSNTDTIRVGLSRYNHGARQLCISSGSSYIIARTEDGSKLASCTGSLAIEVSASGLIIKPSSGNLIDEKSSITVASGEPTGTLTLISTGISERIYRGSVEVTAKGGILKVVNVINVDDYLYGVLPVEMGESYPQEALRAQAITARTYALGNRRKHAAQGFDICDGTHCQTYGGVSAEKPKCNQAVIDTRGMVLTFSGRVASVMYSTDCGGATVNYDELRPGTSYPYLRGTIDPDDIQHTSWEQAFTLQDLSAKLAATRIKEATELRSIIVAKIGFSGRPLEIDITDGQEKTTITAEKIRTALGLKSTMFTVETNADGKVTFKGKGSGHGVGLCQRGAKGLASAPHNYTCAQILSHYFPGTCITNGTPSASPPSSDTAAMPVQQTVTSVAAFPVREARVTKPAEVTKKGPDTFDVRLQAPDRL
ncbi:MAG: SpoIID/LytB domain-containing protein [Armatimonadota bacterium]